MSGTSTFIFLAIFFVPFTVSFRLFFKAECDIGTYTADPYDCAKYYQCDDGKWTEETCATGTVWNPAVEACDNPKNVNCTISTSTTSTTTTTAPSTTTVITPSGPCDIGTYAAYEGDCTKFLQCDEGHWIVVQCPPDEAWDQRILNCVPGAPCDNSTSTSSSTSTSTTTTPTTTTTTTKATSTTTSPITQSTPGGYCDIGTYAAYDGDCTKFLQCDESHWIVVQCPPDEVWDQRILNCVTGAPCDNSTSTSSSTSTTTTTTPTTTSPITQSTPGGYCDIGTYAAYDGDCTKFLQCDESHWIVVQCPPGEVWDQRILNCVTGAPCDNSTSTSSSSSTNTTTTPTTTTKATTTPGSTEAPISCNNIGELYAYPGDCTKFYECDGVQLVALSCEEGLYWNDPIKECDYPENVNCDYTLPPSNSTTSTSSTPTKTPTISPQSTTTKGPQIPCDKDGDLSPVPGDCYHFYKCFEGFKVLEDCPPSLVWNDKIQECDWLANVPECQ